MLKTERQNEILNILSCDSYISVAQLCKRLFTSPSSIRRDLTELEARGLVKRCHGGVELDKRNASIIPYPIRIDNDAKAKKIIAKKAAALINDGDVIFLDQSSSSSFLAREIAQKQGITVITNNIEIITFLSQYSIRVISCGGNLCSDNRFALVGSDAENTFSQVHADWLVFSCRAVTDEGKIYDVQYEEVAVRKAMIKNAEKKIFLCDQAKISTISSYLQCTLSNVDYMISDIQDALFYKEKFPHLQIL